MMMVMWVMVALVVGGCDVGADDDDQEPSLPLGRTAPPKRGDSRLEKSRPSQPVVIGAKRCRAKSSNFISKRAGPCT